MRRALVTGNDCQEIMDCLRKRLEKKDANWRLCYKALNVVECARPRPPRPRAPAPRARARARAHARFSHPGERLAGRAPRPATRNPSLPPVRCLDLLSARAPAALGTA